jgi:hypothetical protein
MKLSENIKLFATGTTLLYIPADQFSVIYCHSAAQLWVYELNGCQATK